MRKAEEIYGQLTRFVGPGPGGLGLPLASCGDDSTPLRRALTAGLFPHAARLQPDGSYKMLATGRQVSVAWFVRVCGKGRCPLPATAGLPRALPRISSPPASS